MKVNDLDAILAQPGESALKAYGLSHHDRSDSKLTDQAAAIPARREGRDHDFVAIGSLAAGPAKRIGFPMRRRVAFLHPAIVALAEECPIACEQSSADGNSSFRKARVSFRESALQHLGVLFSIFDSVGTHLGSPHPGMAFH